MKKISYVLLLLILSISLNVKGATFTNTILNNNGGKDNIEKNQIPKVTESAPRIESYTDNGTTITGLQSAYSSTSTSYYITYAESYSFDSNTGLYTLNNPSVGQYSSIYSTLSNKYVTTLRLSPNNALNPSNYQNSEIVYKISSAIYNTTDSTGQINSSVSSKTYNYDMSDKKMIAMPDNYGTSYIFRGAVDNNWVKLGQYSTDYYQIYKYDETNDVTETLYDSTCIASDTIDCEKIASAGDDIYWKIIRINGDNSIRLVYSGTVPPTKETSIYDVTNYRNIGDDSYNINSDNKAYLGYMYTLNNDHGYTTDSYIKTIIDSWYKNYFKDNSNYLADNGFCNNRTINNNVSESNTYYNITDRMPSYSFYTSNVASLMCQNKNDLFTTKDTNKGNGALTYPVGILNADEILLAGSKFYENSISFSPVIPVGPTMPMMRNNGNFLKNYLYNYSTESKSLETILTMTPEYYSTNNDNGYILINVNGNLTGVSISIGGSIKPVINLSSSLYATGSGTWDDPYIPTFDNPNPDKVEEVIENPKTGITLTSIIILLLITSILVPVTFILKKEKIKKV
jgi:hypothetical protein